MVKMHSKDGFREDLVCAADQTFQKYFVGARWYPTRRVTLDVGGYYKNNNYDYDHTLDSTLNNAASANRWRSATIGVFPAPS